MLHACHHPHVSRCRGLTRCCSPQWRWRPEGRGQVWAAVLTPGAAGGRSHTALEERSCRSAAADPAVRAQTHTFTLLSDESGAGVTVWKVSWHRPDLLLSFTLSFSSLFLCPAATRFLISPLKEISSWYTVTEEIGNCGFFKHSIKTKSKC